MSKNLVIVESPAKAKTIKKYLGKDFEVESSFGHIRDLPKKQMGVDIDHDFKPVYEIPADKKKVVSQLKKAAQNKTVWLASDEDREGEAIAWHLCHALKLDPTETKRIVFHEITKPAITQAVANPRTVNQQLVDAQQARRILDRIVGYKLSPVLWRKIRPGLSAGRVQSVAVRLIVEREREITHFQPTSAFKISGICTNEQQTKFSVEVLDKLDDQAAAKSLLEAYQQSSLEVVDIQQKPSLRNPGAPFTTSILQQEAARKLGFSVKQTMTVAQRLYELGHITYMRTDSTTLSQSAVVAAEKYIKGTFGDQYAKTRQYKTKQNNAQEAHEAIRPTRIEITAAGDDANQKKLYELIWKRTVASQMAPAKTDKTTITIQASKTETPLIAKGETLKFDGFLKVYGGAKDDVLLPTFKVGETVALSELVALETFTNPPARYSEAALVRKLEELGIGRPSTYAPTISTIQDRGYVEKADIEGIEREHQKIVLADNKISESTELKTHGADKRKLLPTSVALVTTDFLMKHFAPIVDYNFTARAEEDFDKIALGETKWANAIGTFYGNFEPLLKGSENISREESAQTKKLGDDPKSGKPIYARFGKYGLMLVRGSIENDEKPEFAPLPEGKTLDTITLEDALEMFKLPRLVGQTEAGEDIRANIGRFGPYIQVDKLYVSIKPLDPMTITLEEARERYQEKLQQEKEKYIKTFDSGIQVLKGPYGPYVTDGKKNARIPSSITPKDISETKAKELLAKAKPPKKRYRKQAAKK